MLPKKLYEYSLFVLCLTITFVGLFFKLDNKKERGSHEQTTSFGNMNKEKILINLFKQKLSCYQKTLFDHFSTSLPRFIHIIMLMLFYVNSSRNLLLFKYDEISILLCEMLILFFKTFMHFLLTKLLHHLHHYFQ